MRLQRPPPRNRKQQGRKSSVGSMRNLYEDGFPHD
jgi:hypothetical protein